MSISRDDVAHIARLARLDLTAAETDGLAKDLAQILEYVGRIAALETVDGVPDAGAGTTGPTPFREDVVRPSLPVEEALSPSADHDGAFFRVPPVIDRDEA